MADIIIICGIIEHKGRILIGKKIECEHPVDLGGKWHLPGGRLEKGESLEEGLKREIKEETNLDVEVKENLGSNIVTVKDRGSAKTLFFRCIPKNHDAKPSSDLQEIKWVKKQDVLKILEEPFINLLSKRVMEFFKTR